MTSQPPTPNSHLPKIPTGYKQTEVGVIPEEWEVESLERIADPKRTICYGIVQVGQFSNNGITVLAIKNLNGDYVTNIHRCSPVIEKPYVRSRVRPGDVLVSIKGTIGRVGLVPHHFSGNISRDLARISLTGSDVPEFWHQMLQSEMAQRRIDATTVGTTRLELSIGPLKKVTMPRPPKPEQRAIATALSDVDGLLGGLDRLIAKKRDLKQAAMQQLLTGQTRLSAFQGEWEVKRLGDSLLSRPDYGINAAAVPFTDKLPSYIRITDISEHGRFCPDPRVSVKAASADQYYLHAGDVVFARTGASVGKSYLYEPSDGELVFAGFLIRVRPNPELLISAYLAAYATTKPYWNWVRLMSMRSGQPGINGNEYAHLPLSLPRLPEQTAIAEVLTDMDAELAALEQRREKTHALKQAMMQELLTGRIRLVAQGAAKSAELLKEYNGEIPAKAYYETRRY